MGISDTETSVVAEDADELVYVNTDWIKSSLDEKIIPHVEKALLDTFKNKLIILHFIGNHFSYKNRYPKINFTKITDGYLFPDYINQYQINTINHYDNSIKYTDLIIDSVINKIDYQKSFGAVVYISDHGESVYDTPELFIGHGFPEVTKEVVEIPLLLWLSESYIKYDSIRLKSSIKNQNAPFSSENLFHSLLDLMNIQFDALEINKCLFNPQYIPPTSRTILNSENKLVTYEDL